MIDERSSSSVLRNRFQAQKTIPVCGSEIVFLKMELEERYLSFIGLPLWR